jgi:hypothetical protein
MLKNWNIFPFALALYPILYLYGINASELRPLMAVRAILLIFIFTICLLLLYRLILSGWTAASYLTSFSVILLLSYGHLYHFLRDVMPNGLQIIRHRFLIPTAIVFFICLLWYVGRNQDKLSKFSPFINISSLVLLILPISQIIRAEVRYQWEFNTASEHNSSSCILSVPEGKEAPDIFFIILDAYTREDILLERYDFNNEPFLDELRDLGFYIADSAQSNYGMTALSLESSLNMDYLMDHLGGDIASKGDSNLDDLRNFSIVNSVVRSELECLGYKVVSFDSGWPITSWHNADYFFSPQKVGWERYYIAGTNAFESLLINNSIGLFIIDGAIYKAKQLQDFINYPYSEHAERILFALELDETGVLNLPSPKFVFIHIVSPHFPYIFSPSEEFEDQTESFTLRENEGSNNLGYRDQVEFLNPRVLKMVRDILDASEIPPIILIQGDHGSPESIRGRMAILSAYYFPGGGDQLLYSSITPVNNFRVIFNYYFDASYSLLEDKSYFSDHDAIYDFIKVP